MSPPVASSPQVTELEERFVMSVYNNRTLVKKLRKVPNAHYFSHKAQTVAASLLSGTPVMAPIPGTIDLTAEEMDEAAEMIGDYHLLRQAIVYGKNIFDEASRGDAVRTRKLLSTPIRSTGPQLGNSMGESMTKYLHEVAKGNPFPQLDSPLADFMPLAPGGIYTIAGPPGGGKGLRLSQQLPTPGGVVLAGDVVVGDFLFAQDGSPTEVLGVSEVHHRPCFKVTFDDGASLITDDQHLWEVNYNRRANAEVMSTAQMYAAGTHSTPDGRAAFSVPLCQPAQYPERSLPIEPYLLGVWLGDGSANCGRISTGEQDLKYFKAELTRLGHHVTEHAPDSRGQGRTCNVTGLITALRDIGIYANKHVPDAYLTSSPQQRLALLQGMMDTDGTFSKDGKSIFYNTNPLLARAVRELAHSLGMKASISSKIGRFAGVDHKTCFCVSISRRAEQPVIFRLPRHADAAAARPTRSTSNRRYVAAIEPVDSEPTVCFKVACPRSLYLADRSYIVTHNTAWAEGIAWEMSIKGMVVGDFAVELTEIPKVSRYAQHLMGPSVGLGAHASGRIDTAALSEAARRINANTNLKLIPGVMKLQEVKDAITHQVVEHGLQLAIIDYIQLVTVPGVSNPIERLEIVAVELKEHCQDLGIAQIWLAQLNKEGQKGIVRPTMNNMEGSGRVSQLSWSVAVLDPKPRMPGAATQDVDVYWDKTRYAPTGMSRAKINGAYYDFMVDGQKPLLQRIPTALSPAPVLI